MRSAAENLNGSSSAAQRDANTAAFLDDLDGFLDRVLSVRTSIGAACRLRPANVRHSLPHELTNESRTVPR